MDLINQLSAELSIRNMNYVAQFIGNDKKKFKELMKLVLHGKDPIARYASWSMVVITDQYPELLNPYIEDLIKAVPKFDHTGTKRNVLRQLIIVDIPEKLKGYIFDYCFSYLESAKEPPAVKVYSMEILYNISKNEPDLKRELALLIEGLLPDGSAGIKNRGEKILKRLRASRKTPFSPSFSERAGGKSIINKVFEIPLRIRLLKQF